APRLAGASPLVASAHALLVLVAGGVGVAWDFVAAERILRHGAVPYCAAALIGVALVRWPATRRALRIEGSRVGAVLVTALLVALAVRLVLLLPPQFYSPDVRVHANVA